MPYEQFDLLEYIAENMEYRQQQWKDDEVSISCINPECDNHFRRRMKMSVNIEKQKAFCFKCGASYDNAISFVAAFEEISRFQAMKRVMGSRPKREYGPDRLIRALEGLHANPEESEPEEERPVVLPVHRPLEPDDLAFRYLAGRGFDARVIDQFGLSLCMKPGPFMGRILIPVYQDGKLISYQGRTIVEGMKPKYLFPTDVPFHNGLYNWDMASRHDWVVLVEGVTDLWRMWLRGYPNTAATFGKTLKQEQFRLLVGRPEIKTVVFFWDGEALENTWRAVDQLISYKSVFVAELPGGMEPDDCPDPGKYISSAIHANSLSRLERRLRGAGLAA